MFLLLLFFIARIVMKRKPFFESRSRNTRKNTAKLLQSLQAHITKYIGYNHIFMSVRMKLLILTEAFFQNAYHDMVDSSMRDRFM